MATKSFEQLVVWQKGHEYVLSIYVITKKFPKDEFFCLTNQFRRAAISITANIAEGFAKQSPKDKLRFYNIAQGSLEETRNFALLACDLNYISKQERDDLSSQASIVSAMLNRYCQSLIKNTQQTE